MQSGARRVLIIDDDDGVREAARMSLEVLGGHNVLTAACGEDGLARALTERPDAILLDVRMPGMDGPATFACLQADVRTRAIPVILFTSTVGPADLERYARLGVRAVLSKPFDRAKLAGQVAAILGWAHARPEPHRATTVSEIWARHRDEVFARVDTIDDAVRDQLTGQIDEQRRDRGCREAHKLAGSAGTFGYLAASEIAGRLERALSADSAQSGGQRWQLADMVVALRRELEAIPT